MRRQLALLATAIAMAGCATTAPGALQPTPQGVYVTPPPAAAAPSPAVTALPTAAPTATLAPAPVTLTIEEAGKAYLAAVKPYNKEGDRVYKKYGSKTSLASNRKLYSLYARSSDKWIDALKLIAFPPEVQADAKALIKAEIVYQRRVLSASKARDSYQLLVYAQDAHRQSLKVADLAAVLRDDLGLPPNS